MSLYINKQKERVTMAWMGFVGDRGGSGGGSTHKTPKLLYTLKQTTELTQVHKSILALLYQGMGKQDPKEELLFDTDRINGYIY